jgi:DNA-binding CsgD family transcriptional regulator
MAAAPPDLAHRVSGKPRIEPLENGAHVMLDADRSSGGLLDRASERERLEALVPEIRGGQSRVLVLRGEAGVGKSALLRYLAAAAGAGCRLVRVAGVESELELAFAGLHALCAPLLDRLGGLPSPQRAALTTAFGLSARDAMRSAHEDFSRFGAEGSAERARRELLAAGETVRRATPDSRDALTPQELQVARLAGEGHTNPEIGAQLFISPRTVQYHLHKVFRKLAVDNRKALRSALRDTQVRHRTMRSSGPAR